MWRCLLLAGPSMGTGQIAAGGRARAPQQQQVQALSQLLTGPGVGGTLVLCTEVTIATITL